MDETPLPFVPSVWNVISKKKDPTTLNTGRSQTHRHTDTHNNNMADDSHANTCLMSLSTDGSEKDSVTAVCFITLSGIILPTAIVKRGKTEKCLKSKSMISVYPAYVCRMSCRHVREEG